MKVGTAVLFAFAISWYAVDSSAQGATCEVLAASVARATGARAGSRTKADDIAFIHPASSEMSIACPDARPILGVPAQLALTVFSEEPRPTAAYFGLIASAASALFDVSTAIVEHQATVCRQQALNAANGSAQMFLEKVQLSCSAGPNFGGLSQVTVIAR